MRRSIVGQLGVGLAAVAGIAIAQPAGPLARVQPGQWQLKEVGATDARTVCLSDPSAALQIGHGGARCTQSVIDSGPNALTVHYSCPGAGHGRSTITLHGAGAFRLQTQGMAGGAPFDFDYQARRIGDCGGAAIAPR